MSDALVTAALAALLLGMFAAWCWREAVAERKYRRRRAEVLAEFDRVVAEIQSDKAEFDRRMAELGQHGETLADTVRRAEEEVLRRERRR